MEALLKVLTEDEIIFVCSFANRYISQTPYVEPHNVKYLMVDYFIKHLKAKMKSKTFSVTGKNIAKKILDKFGSIK